MRRASLKDIEIRFIPGFAVISSRYTFEIESKGLNESVFRLQCPFTQTKREPGIKSPEITTSESRPKCVAHIKGIKIRFIPWIRCYIPSATPSGQSRVGGWRRELGFGAF